MHGLTLLGQGREAEVFGRPDGSVLKLMRDAAQHPALTREAAALAALATGDGLAPRLRGRITVDGRPGLVLDRVNGPDLLSLVGSRPWLLRRAGLALAAVHARVHAQVAPPRLPDLQAELDRRIRSAPGLPAMLASWALSVLGRLPNGDRLCHGDLHLGNVLGSLDTPVVIDWGEATRGDPVADVAHTWVLHQMGHPPPGASLAVRAGIPFLRRILVSRYLTGYRKRRPFDDDQFRRWQVVRVAARVDARIDEEHDTLIDWLQSARRSAHR